MNPENTDGAGNNNPEQLNNVIHPNNTPPANDLGNNSDIQPQQPQEPVQVTSQAIQPDATSFQPQIQPVVQTAVVAQPQPQYASQMIPQQAVTPNLNNAYLDKSAPGITFGVWSIITSIIPIIGFILGIVAVIKGFTGTHKNKVLGVLGIIGILLSIGFFVLTLLLISLIDKPTYGELTTKSGTLSGQYSDSGYYDYSFDYPADFTMTDVPVRNAVVFEDVSDVNEENSVSKIILVVEELEADSALSNEKIFESELGKQTIGKLIADTMGTEVESTVITSVDTEYNALFGNAVLFEYTSVASPGVEIQGSFVFVLNSADSTGYNFFLGSTKDVWSTNLDVFTEVRDSLNNK